LASFSQVGVYRRDKTVGVSATSIEKSKTEQK
jgi:hypothetical protein